MAKKSTRLEILQDLFQENGITPEKIEKNSTLIMEIKKNADTIPDYRHPSYTRHLLGDIVMIVFFAILGNANEWEEIGAFAKKKEAWLRQYLELPNGIPDHDTIRVVMGNINAKHFFELAVQILLRKVDEILSLSEKGNGIREMGIVCVDGKESRGSKRKDRQDGEVKAYQTLNVYSGDYGLCIAQEFIMEKTNEIPAAQQLLGLMDLKGTIVTADAMNCQKETVSAITGSGGDYVLALKGNHPLFYKEIREFFDKGEREKLRGRENCWKRTVEKEHGGTAVREYYITGETGWYAERKAWKKLDSFGMVHKELRKQDGSFEEENRYYISSIGENVTEFERAVRGHWGVENNVHWQLDFTFRDDKNTSMAGTGAKNLQTMKKIVLSVLRLVKESYKMSMKMIRYNLSLDYENGVEKLLSMLDTESIKQVLESNRKPSTK